MELTSLKTDLAAYPISEKKARGQIGLTRDEIRALRNRHLSEGLHYARGKQQSVWLNQAGLDVLLANLAPRETVTRNRAVGGNPHVLHPVKAQLLNLLATRVAQLQKTPAPVTLRVVNCALKHPHLIVACALDDDPHRPKRPVRVRVNRTDNFIRGMEIPAQPVAGYTDLYELTRKCPRQKGKW